MPLLPSIAVREPVWEYAIGKVLEFIPESSLGEVVVLFQIQGHICVKTAEACQKVVGHIIDVKGKSNSVSAAFEKLKNGPTLEARIYDPLYISIEDSVPIYNGYPYWEHPRRQYPQRRHSACLDFARFDRNPMHYLSRHHIASQTRPIIDSLHVLRQFFPDQELAGERGAAVILWNAPRGESLHKYGFLKNPRFPKEEVEKKCKVIFEDLLRVNFEFTDAVLPRLVIERSGEIRLDRWGWL
jgi:hypothetical protein